MILEHEIILPSGNSFRLQHSYYETVTNRDGVRFDVCVLVCVLERQFIPDDRALQKIVSSDLLHRRPYKGEYVPPPKHEVYVPQTAYVPQTVNVPQTDNIAPILIDLMDDDDEESNDNNL